MKQRIAQVLSLALVLSALPVRAQMPPQDLGAPAPPGVPGPQLPPGTSPPPPPAPAVSALPDLAGKIRLSGPAREKAGETQALRVEIRNLASKKKGTPPPTGRLEADVLLLASGSAATKGVRKGPGVLARQRITVKRIPRPGGRETAKARVAIPEALETGSYLWCVEVDPSGRVRESDEANNLACLQPALRIAGREPGPAAPPAEEAARVPAAREIERGSERPAALLPPGVPEGAVATDAPVALLTLNDDPAGPVDAWRDDRVVAAWTVPPAEGDALILAMSETSIEDCPRNRNVRDALGDLERDHVVTPDTGLRTASGSLPLRLSDPAYREGATYHVKGCVVREGRTTGRHTNIVPLRFGHAVATGPVVATAETLYLPPDLVVHDIQVLTAPGAEGRLWITIKDRSGRFREWYAANYERPCPAGRYCPLREADIRARERGETAYRFPYVIEVDGERVTAAAPGGGGLHLAGERGRPSGYTHLPRSGRQSIITTGYRLPADGRAHTVRVELNPEGFSERVAGGPRRWPPETDYANNELTRELRRELRVRLRLSFGEFLVMADGDRRSSGELKHLKVRLCREGGGCSARAEAHARDRALGRGGLVYGNPLSIDTGDTINGVFTPSTLEIAGSTEDRYFIEVYAYEDDGPCFFANCDDWGTLELRFPIPPRMRTGVPDACGAANTFMPAIEDRLGGELSVSYRGAGNGPSIEPTRSRICVYRTFGAPGE